MPHTGKQVEKPLRFIC